MIITEQAKQALRYAIQINKDESWHIFRLVSDSNSNFDLIRAEKELPEDDIVELDGVKILAIEDTINQSPLNLYIDFVANEDGAELFITYNDTILQNGNLDPN
ncbi:MAG: hypothetical protein NTV30_09785 [Chloroflexi bacterium]|nr:hypothetical protein [Chloroflexota bacterium]